MRNNNLSNLLFLELSNEYNKVANNKFGSLGVKYLTKAFLPLLQKLWIGKFYGM